MDKKIDLRNLLSGSLRVLYRSIVRTRSVSIDVGTLNKYVVVHTIQRISPCFQALFRSRLSASNGIAKAAVNRSQKANEKMKDMAGEERRLLFRKIARHTRLLPRREMTIISE